MSKNDIFGRASSPPIVSLILSFGSSLVCPTKIYVGIGSNKIASLQYEITIPKNKFIVTIVTDTGDIVADTSIHCNTTNQDYMTDSSGRITQTIETELEVKSLEFIWSANAGSTWSKVDGSLEQESVLTNNYTGIATVSSGILFEGECDTTVETISSETSNYSINVSPQVGEYIEIGTRQYLIAHVDNDIAYAVLRYYENYITWSIGTTSYSESSAAASCVAWYQSSVPSVWKTSANAFTKVSTEGVSAECFIPAYSQVNGGWDYFSSNERRIFRDSGGNAQYWWTSTAAGVTTVRYVEGNGTFSDVAPYGNRGFRPALAIKRSLFTS